MSEKVGVDLKFDPYCATNRDARSLSQLLRTKYLVPFGAPNPTPHPKRLTTSWGQVCCPLPFIHEYLVQKALDLTDHSFRSYDQEHVVPFEPIRLILHFSLGSPSGLTSLVQSIQIHLKGIFPDGCLTCHLYSCRDSSCTTYRLVFPELTTYATEVQLVVNSVRVAIMLRSGVFITSPLDNYVSVFSFLKITCSSCGGENHLRSICSACHTAGFITPRHCTYVPQFEFQDDASLPPTATNDRELLQYLSLSTIHPSTSKPVSTHMGALRLLNSLDMKSSGQQRKTNAGSRRYIDGDASFLYRLNSFVDKFHETVMKKVGRKRRGQIIVEELYVSRAGVAIHTIGEGANDCPFSDRIHAVNKPTTYFLIRRKKGKCYIQIKCSDVTCNLVKQAPVNAAVMLCSTGLYESLVRARDAPLPLLHM